MNIQTTALGDTSVSTELNPESGKAAWLAPRSTDLNRVLKRTAAMVLAGGQGERLSSLTDNGVVVIPKGMVIGDA